MKIIFALIAFFYIAQTRACELPGIKNIELTAAKHFTLQQYNDGYVLEVLSPWQGGNKKYRYLLHRSNKPLNCPDMHSIKIPVKRLVAFSTSYLPALKELHQLESLIATVDARYISDPVIIEKVKNGSITSLGYPPAPEKVLSLSPDIIMAFVSESPEMEGVSRLEQLKLPVVFNADFREKHPVGRAEWIRFIGAFYDREELATKTFKKISDNYNLIRSKVTSMTKRPIVLLGEKKGSLWQAPGGASYLNRFVEEAGGEYLFKSNDQNYPQNFSFEDVYQKSKQVEVWISFSPWKNYQQVIAEDRRNDFFFNDRIKIYFGNKLQNENGGNDYFETGAIRPDLVLADFIGMIHPELSSAHNLKWFIPIEKAKEIKK